MWIFSNRAQRSRIQIPQESCTYSVTVGGIQTCNTGAEVQLAWISISDPVLTMVGTSTYGHVELSLHRYEASTRQWDTT